MKNLLFITADQWRGECLSALDHLVQTPHLDALATRGVQAASIPVLPGISPGSGPGHLGLFGYDPVQYKIGRGALEATGIGFELQKNDVAIRCNFCTLDEQGNILKKDNYYLPLLNESYAFGQHVVLLERHIFQLVNLFYDQQLFHPHD